MFVHNPDFLDWARIKLHDKEPHHTIRNDDVLWKRLIEMSREEERVRLTEIIYGENNG